MPSTQPPYNTAALRRLIMQAFSDEEFTIFCFDHFREVRQQFTSGMTLLAKTQLLLEHCERTNAFPHLLPLLAEANPAKYAEFADSLQKSTPQSTTVTHLKGMHSGAISNLQSLSSRQPFEPEMILIPAGEFLMGSDPLVDKYAEDNEQPQHRLYLPDYYMAKTPVTNAQYAAFIQATNHSLPLHWDNEVPPQGKEDHPIVFITWRDVMAYCRWLAGITNHSYILSSEAEWEKAARGTDGRIYPWGNNWDARLCNSSESEIGVTMPVESYSKGASPYGLLNMAGNVWELTRNSDYFYPYDPTDGREDLEEIFDGLVHIARGGAFNSSKLSMRCAIRFSVTIINRDFNIGFRVAMSPF